MIRRSRGAAALARADAYPARFHASVLPELKRLPGLLGARLARRRLDAGQIELLVLTHWQSLHAIRGFAGDDVKVAMIEPDAVAALEDFDRHVRHYEVIEELFPPAG